MKIICNRISSSLIAILALSFCFSPIRSEDTTDQLSLDSLFSITDESSQEEQKSPLRYLDGGAPFAMIDISKFLVPESSSEKIGDAEVEKMIEQIDRSQLNTLVGWSGKQTLKRDSLSLQKINQLSNEIPESSTKIEVSNDFELLEIDLTFVSNGSNDKKYALKLHSKFNDQIILPDGFYQPVLTVWSRENPDTILILEFKELKLDDQQLYRLKLDESWERDSIKKLREQASRNQSVSIKAQ